MAAETSGLNVARDPAASEALQASLMRALEATGLTECASASLVDLDANRSAGWRSQQNIYPASVIKVAIMAETFHQYSSGRLELEAPVVVADANQTTTDAPTPFKSGYRTTISELVEYMIAFSDNIATNQLMDVLRRERVTEYMRSLGLATFLLGRKLSGSEPLIVDSEVIGMNRMPAGEIARLLCLIARDELPGAAEQRAILARCVHNDKLAAGLAKDDVFMHKTGETSDVSHDAGILTTADDRHFVIVLYTQVTPNPDGSDAAHANPAMARCMRSLRAEL
ncbi:MAG: class A beta-lactamase-related serine hydrolase [Candidatus Eremiobacteraeota bacterium]|nr:class A beta-lactamase-related serine hydrolase [Candidatus Eremiobacteraeota bacterium]